MVHECYKLEMCVLYGSHMHISTIHFVTHTANTLLVGFDEIQVK